LVAEGGDPVAVDVGSAQLSAGMRSFLADDDAHSGRPGGQVEQAGEFSDERAVADLAVGVVGRGPRRRRDPGDGPLGAGGEHEPDRVGQSLPDQPVQERVSGAGAVGADQHLPSWPGAGTMTGQLRQGLAGDGDVIGGGVRPGVARPEQHRERLTRAVGAVVGERPQRVVTEAALERRRRSFLLRVGPNQSRVEIDDQRTTSIDLGVGSMDSGEPPRGGAGRRPRGGDRSQGFRIAGEQVDGRDTVGSEATEPNSSGAPRSSATSARQSPPRASVTARSTSTFAGSCRANGFRHGASATNSPAAATLPERQIPGDPELGHAIAAKADDHGTWITAIDDPYLPIFYATTKLWEYPAGACRTSPGSRSACARRPTRRTTSGWAGPSVMRSPRATARFC